MGAEATLARTGATEVKAATTPAAGIRAAASTTSPVAATRAASAAGTGRRKHPTVLDDILTGSRCVAAVFIDDLFTDDLGAGFDDG